MCLFRVLIESKKYATGQFKMSEESRKQMAMGKLPTRGIDRQHVPQTYFDYRDTTQRLLAILSKRLKREVHMEDFWKFGTVDLVQPQQNIHQWLTEDIQSLGTRYESVFE